MTTHTDKKQRVCPVEMAGGLDNAVRRFLQNPNKILKPYIKKGMTVLDLGCGPGFFSIEMAKMLGGSGKVIAADLQQGMLDRVSQKIKGSSLEKLIALHKCEAEKTGLAEKVDFILAFYMIHEVPDQDRLFNELISLLKPNGILYIIEPNFHVSKKSFTLMVEKLTGKGLEIIEKPKIFFSRTIALTLQDSEKHNTTEVK